ncbi:MAG: RagB/SusD family nutrient uptake outer membrane protein [Bacteroidales bacterium]|nr:RagB/SusD family nutrient uptake outer membrane protein [Bacteroidales bacterium]
MKNIYKTLILLGFITLGISCTEDFVDLSNPNSQTAGTYWQTEDDAVKAVNSVYTALLYDGLYMRLYPWIQDIRADDMRNTSPWWTTDLSNYVTSPDNPCYFTSWQQQYRGIYWANQVISYVPDIDMDEDLKERILGEAKFLRGLYLYHLAILYRNIPVITTIPESVDDFFPAQSTPEEAWAQVIADLTDAMNVLPVKEEYSSADIGRATKGSAAGYLAKTYMITQQWSEAEPILKGIIDGDYGNYALVADYKDNFTEENENNEESLFEVQFDYTVGGTTLGWVGDPALDWSKTSGKARTYAPLGFGWGDITPTDWIYDEFMLEPDADDSIDYRAKVSMFFDYPGCLVYGREFNDVVLSNFVHVAKYLNTYNSAYANENEWRSGINERILRYADILLLYAECLNEQGRTAEAYPYIQEVRDRANLRDLAIEKPGMTQDEMRMQLDHERALEFCFEAQRYVDLVRWGYFDDPDKVALLISRDEEYEDWTAGREYLAIPQTELDVNSNLVQNPGWE